MIYLSYKEAIEYTRKQKHTLQNLRRKSISDGITEFNGQPIFKKGALERGHHKVLILKDFLDHHFPTNDYNSEYNSPTIVNNTDKELLQDYCNELKKQVDSLNDLLRKTSDQLSESQRGESELRKLLAVKEMENQKLLQEKKDSKEEPQIKYTPMTSFVKNKRGHFRFLDYFSFLIFSWSFV